MAIRPYEVQVATNPVGRTSSQFSTNMPEPDLRGIQRLAGVMSDMGEQQMKDAADKAVDVAVQDVTVKNPDGSWAIVKAPDTFGSYASRVFDQAVEKKYVNEVYRTSEETLNLLATDPSLTTDQALFKMKAHVEAVTKNVDPKYKDQVSFDLMREYNERMRGLLTLQKSKDISALTTSTQNDVDNAFAKALDVYTADNVSPEMLASARQQLERGLESAGILFGMQYNDPVLAEKAMTELKDRISSIEQFAPVLKDVRQSIKDGTATPDEVNTLAQMLTIGSTPAGSTAFGITEADVVDIHPLVRAAFKKMLDPLSADYGQKFATTQKEKDSNNIVSLIGSGQFSTLATTGISNESITEGYIKYARDNGIDAFTPAGILTLANQTNGFLPKGLYQKTFDSLPMLDPSNKDDLATLERNIVVYKQLKSITLNSGSIVDLSDTLDNKTRVMMEAISYRYDLDNNAATAFKFSKAVADKYEGDNGAARMAVVYDTLGKQTKSGVIQDIIGSKEDLTTFSAKVPVAAWDTIVQDMSYGLYLGLSPDQAKKIAKSNFEKTWKVDPYVQTEGGGAFTKNPLPTVKSDYRIDSESTTEYIVPFVQQALDQKIDWAFMAEKYGMNIPKDKLVLGKNIKLQATGDQSVVDQNGTKAGLYKLVYLDPASGSSIDLLGTDKKAFLIVPAKAAQLVLDHNFAVNKYVSDEMQAGRTVNAASIGTSIEKIKVNEGFWQTGFTESGLSAEAFNIFGTNKTETPIPALNKDMDRLDAFVFGSSVDPKTIFNANIDKILPNENVQAARGQLDKPQTAQIEGYINVLTEEANRLGIPTYTNGLINLITYESRWVVGIKNPKSSAKGLGQMIDDTWDIYKVNSDGTIMDRTPENELKASVRYVADLHKKYNKVFGKNPEMGDIYVMYNQGASGGMKLLLANPNANAIKTLEPAYTDKRNANKAVINQFEAGKGDINMTVGQFLASLRSRVKG